MTDHRCAFDFRPHTATHSLQVHVLGLVGTAEGPECCCRGCATRDNAASVFSWTRVTEADLAGGNVLASLTRFTRGASYVVPLHWSMGPVSVGPLVACSTERQVRCSFWTQLHGCVTSRGLRHVLRQLLQKSIGLCGSVDPSPIDLLASGRCACRRLDAAPTDELSRCEPGHRVRRVQCPCAHTPRGADTPSSPAHTSHQTPISPFFTSDAARL